MPKLILLLTLLMFTACESFSTPTPARLNASTSTTSDQPSASSPPTSSPQPSNPPTLQPSNPTSPSTPLPQGGTAILGLVGQPESLNPIAENNRALQELTPLLFDTLLRADPTTAQLGPGLAESWGYSEAGQQVIFHLPANLKWSDGMPLTAAAIAASLKATEHPALLSFSQISAPDPQTLTLTLVKIDCAAVTTLAQLPLLPATEILETMPRGSGPFRVDDWSANKRSLTLARNPNYHGPGPALDGLSIRFIAPDEVAVALSEGQFDLVGPFQSKIQNPKSPISNLQSPTLTEIVYPAPQVIYLAINYAPRNEEPLEPKVRQALLAALDREAILTEALNGAGHLMAGSLLPGHWAAHSALSWPDYDPQAARRLLAETGLKDEDGDGWLDQAGERLELGLRLNGENSLHQDLGWLVSSYYRDLGLFAQAESVAFDNLVDDLFTHDFELALFSWPLLPDPDQRLYWRSTENEEGVGLNFTSYDNPRLDRLLDQAVAMPGCDTSTRAKIYADIQEILAQERPVDFLLTPHNHLLLAHRLQGVKPGPFAPLTWNVTNWYLKGE